MLKDIEEKDSPIKIDLTGPEGNALILIRLARRLGRQLEKDVDKIIKEMESGDYENLIEEMDKASLIELFDELGSKASYHFADDSGREWEQGTTLKRYALKLFDACPELQSEMREKAKEFLWSLQRDRPRDTDRTS